MPGYDQRYFDKWYRDPKHRISLAAATRRKVLLALSVAEYFLERPVRTVLDFGCGEGQWQPILKKLRPGIQYLGVDPSEYAVKRYGKTRHLQLGGFETLPALHDSYDLVVCSDLLYYIPARELRAGFGALVDCIGGIAFLEAYPTDIPLVGDKQKVEPRRADFYRRLFRRHGLVSCGTHCYASPRIAAGITPLERGGV